MAKLLHAAADGFTRLLEIVMVLCMLVMFVMVFGNVIMRLFFNSGFDLSEELPRFAFVWMTFLGAVVVLYTAAAVGAFIGSMALPVLGRRVCWGISQAIMLVCCGYIVYGTWLQNDILAGNASPVAQLSMLWVFGVSYLTGGAIGFMCLSNLVRLALGHVSDDELIEVHEEGMEEARHAEQDLGHQQQQQQGGRA